jgi:lysophospholipase L1-like esterase
MYCRFKSIVILIFLFIVIVGCSEQNKTIKLTQDSVILAFGDSLTKGTGGTVNKSYPNILQTTLGITVINEGIPGETSSKGLQRLDKTLKLTTPSLVILCHGGNDILKGLSKEKLEHNLAQMIELIQSYGAEVMLVGVPKPSINLSTLPLYERLASQYMLVSDLKSLPDLLKQRSMKSDSVHLNDKGYRQLALNLAAKIQFI